jgi:uncharacterized protein YndB with AHSA1/START domain
MVPERLEREIFIEAPPDVVWAVVTEPEHVSGWFSDAAEIDLRPGGRITLIWHGHGTEHGRIERVEPPSFFSFRWFRGSGTEVRDDDSTLVELTLTADGDGTLLKVVESGFRELSGPDDEKAKDAEDHRRGWERELDELSEYVSRQVGAP